MTDFAVPLWGQLSIVSVLLAFVGIIVTAILRGNLITGKRQDQIDAQHKAEIEAERERSSVEVAAANERSKLWQEAWQAGQSLAAQQTDAIARLTASAEAFEIFLKSLPRLPGEQPHDS